MSDQAPPAWMQDIPEDLRSNPTLTTFKGNDWKEVGPMIAKSYVESRSLIGKKIDDFFPKEDWKPEQHAEFNKRLGVPDAPDKYQIDAALAEKAGLKGEDLKNALAMAHQMGLTPKQLQAYIKTAAEGSDLAEKNRAKESEKAAAAIKLKYGDKLPAKQQLVKQILALGGGDLADRISNAGFGNDPQLFDALVSLGEKFVESQSGGTSGKSGFGANKEEAKQRIDAIKAERASNPTIDAKYFDPKSAERAEWNRLHAVAFNP